MAIIKMTTTNAGEYVGIKERKVVQSLWKSIWSFLKKVKIELPHNPAVQLLGIHPKECKSTYKRDTCTPMFIAALFTIAKIWNQDRCSTTND
jgi:hypothetical protein